MALTARKVVQCDLNGNEIHCFSSAKEASISLGGKDATRIFKAIRYGFIAYSYRWKYLGSDLLPLCSGSPGKRREVVAYNLSSKEETTFSSVSLASRELGIRITAIESSLQTGCKAKGFRFRYLDSNYVVPSKQEPYKKAVVAIDKEGNPVREYPSVKEAALALGVNQSAIYWCLNPKHPTSKCKGYRFRYKEQ